MFVIRCVSPLGDAYAGNGRAGLCLDVASARKFAAGGDAGEWLDGMAGRLPGCDHLVEPFSWPEAEAFRIACQKPPSIPCCYPEGGGAHAPDPAPTVPGAALLRGAAEAGGHVPPTGPPPPSANGHPGRVA